MTAELQTALLEADAVRAVVCPGEDRILTSKDATHLRRSRMAIDDLRHA